MASKAYHKEKKAPIELTKDTEEYKRVHYSLKMALRMVNANFSSFTCAQINQPAPAHDHDQDKTAVECWMKADESQKDCVQKTQTLNFPQNKPMQFTVGSIVNSPSDLPLSDTNNTYFLCKVVIGRAFCFRAREPNLAPPNECPENYDSVYMDRGQLEQKTVYSLDYFIYKPERVTVLHQVSVKIQVDSQKQSDTNTNCSICSHQGLTTAAEFYCLNDRAYFCDEHWKSFHKLYEDARQSENEDLWLQKHKKVAVEMRPNDFDFCEEHKKRPHEYFDTLTSKAYCSLCVVEGKHTSADKATKSQLISIEKAYSNAQDDALKEDLQLNTKKKTIEEQLLTVKKKMNRIKENAVSIQATIQQILEDCLKTMHGHVQKKADILKSDRQELVRQRQEITYVKEFLKAQASQSAPLEFLKLYAGHALIKDQILKQWPKVSMDLQEDKEFMKISGRTVVQAAEVPNQVRDTQNLKQKMQPALDRAKGQFELKQQALLQNQKSSKFITKLFKQAQDEFGSRPTTNNNENLSKNTGGRQTMDFARGSTDHPLQDESNRPQKEVGTLIERLFNSIEKKLKISEYGGQVDEALRCSVFGEFSKNFK